MSWQCGDCGAVYDRSVDYCTRRFDDYLSLRGGSIESAIQQAVDKAIAPIVKQAEARLRSRELYMTPVFRPVLVRSLALAA